MKLRAETVFCFFYFLTTALGAVLLSTEIGSSLVQILYVDLNFYIVKDSFRPLFFVFVLAPFFVVPILVRGIEFSLPQLTAVIAGVSERARVPGSLEVCLFLSIGVVIYVLAVLIGNGFATQALLNFQSDLPYGTMVDLRHNMMNTLASSLYYEIIYVILPSIIWFVYYLKKKSQSDCSLFYFIFTFSLKFTSFCQRCKKRHC